jgi:hypothetical protein
MDNLVENLYNNNVIFSYYGFIDESVLNHVLEITRSKLLSTQEPDAVVNKVHDAIYECVEHTIRHNFYPDDSRMHYKSLLVVSRQKGHYLIDSINVINSQQKQAIHTQLKYLHTKTHDELLSLKARDSRHRDEQIVNPGLVDLVLKSGNCDCTFKELEQHHLFNVNYKVDFLN